MAHYMRFGIWALLIACATAAWCAPGERDAYIGYVYPAGGQQGAVVQVLVGGQRLRGVNGAVVTGEGVRVSVLNYVGPMGPLNQAQQDELKRRIAEIQKQRFSGKDRENRTPPQEKKEQPAETMPPKTVTLPDLPELRNLEQKTPQQLHEIADKFLNRNKRPKPPLAEEVTLQITIDPAAKPGDRELRLLTPSGLSNPLVFQVGNLPELREPEKEGQTLNEPVTVPVVINGQIMPGQVDRFPLQLRGGQQLRITAQARKLIPYLADAVPGWFQAVLTLYDAEGKEAAFADDHLFDPDPVLVYRAPRDGSYRLEIRDAIYRGRQDFVYRIVITEQPAATPDGNRTSAMPALDDLLPRGVAWTQSQEMEPNDTGKQTKPLALPHVVSGCIAKAGDVDLFQITGRAGDELVAEVYARRLGSPLDALLRVLDASGRVVAWNDDHEDAGAGLLTHHADAYLSVRLPATGAYYVQVSDVQRHGGDAYRYALRIGPPQPDFALRLTSASLTVPAGRAAPVTVCALRKDGWNGDIEVVLKEAPAGFTLQGARIPAGQDVVRMTLTAPSRFFPQPVVITLEGRAQVGNATVTRPVVPAEQMMQAFAYYHLAPAQQLAVKVGGGGLRSPSITVANGERVRIPAGGRVEVACTIQPMPNTPIKLELSEPPAGVTLQEVKTTPNGLILVLAADDKHTGYAGNLIVEASTEAEWKRPDGQARKQRVSLGILPAIPCEIVPR